MLQAVKDESLQDIIENTSGPLVVKFSANWCSWCQLLAEILEELEPTYGPRATWYEVNTDDRPDLKQQYEIETVPTMILFKDGQVVDRSEAAERGEVEPVLDRWLPA